MVVELTSSTEFQHPFSLHQMYFHQDSYSHDAPEAPINDPNGGLGCTILYTGSFHISWHIQTRLMKTLLVFSCDFGTCVFTVVEMHSQLPALPACLTGGVFVGCSPQFLSIISGIAKQVKFCVYHIYLYYLYVY